MIKTNFLTTAPRFRIDAMFMVLFVGSSAFWLLASGATVPQDAQGNPTNSNKQGTSERKKKRKRRTTATNSNSPSVVIPAPHTGANQAAEKLAKDWFDALDRLDLNELLRISDPPFYSPDDKLLLTTDSIREVFAKAIAEQKPGHSFMQDDPIRSIRAVAIGDLKNEDFQLTGNQSFNNGLLDVHHRVRDLLKLSHKDFVVIVTLQRGHPAVYLLYTRQVGSEMKLAGAWRD